MSKTAIPDADERLIRVWFGREVISSYTASAADAVRYAERTRLRYAGLRVTIDPADGTEAAKLPESRQWPLTVI